MELFGGVERGGRRTEAEPEVGVGYVGGHGEAFVGGGLACAVWLGLGLHVWLLEVERAAR